MILFAAPEFESMAAGLRESIAHLERGSYRAERFNNGELFIQLEPSPTGQECVILGSIAPPDAQMLTTLLLAHTLRKDGAKRITGVLPYLAYSRQDKNKPEESLAAAWTGSLAFASGFDRVITVDVHSRDDERIFQVPLISISPAPVFGAALNRYQLTGATIIAPDQAAIPRCEAIRAAAGLEPAAIPWFEKHRDETGIQHARFIGEVGAQAVLIDDILDTGATLVSACKRVFPTGVEAQRALSPAARQQKELTIGRRGGRDPFCANSSKDIEVMVTHGLFTGDEWEQLWEFGVSRIFCSDTVPRPSSAGDDRIVTLSVVSLIADTLRS